MAINFSELGLTLSEEQQSALTDAISREIDRERTRASQTAHSNADAAWESKLPELIQSAVAKHTAEATMTAEQKAQQQYAAQIAELQANYEALRAANVIAENKNKVRAAGITDDAAVDSIASMFTSNPEGIDGFIEVYNASVNAGIKAAQTKQMHNATPPGASNAGSRGNYPAALTQDTISQMVKSNADTNGGYLNEDQLFADLRVAQNV